MEKLSQQKIKDFKKLQLKKHRNAEQLLYLEGETLIKDLLVEFPQLVLTLVLTEDKLPEFEQYKKELLVAPFADLEKLTQLISGGKKGSDFSRDEFVAMVQDLGTALSAPRSRPRTAPFPVAPARSTARPRSRRSR